ncbi:MAG: response regulator transcription factor [Planctomycetes bacterium]|nr:response regulator transcription factor [Planctomycetota bacterium]
MTQRILLADDHRIFRDGLRPLLAAQPDLEVVAEADNGLDALRLAREVRPTVAVLDISMPGLNGLEVTRRLLQESPEIRVVILSMNSDRRFVREALRAGARGYVLKDSGFDELVLAVRSVVAGRLHLCSSLSEQVIGEYLSLSESDDAGTFSVLSAREREVLQLLSEGLTTKMIAGRLNLSAKTIETHRKSVMDKLDIRSIAELTKYAIREGLTPLD